MLEMQRVLPRNKRCSIDRRLTCVLAAEPAQRTLQHQQFMIHGVGLA